MDKYENGYFREKEESVLEYELVYSLGRLVIFVGVYGRRGSRR